MSSIRQNWLLCRLALFALALQLGLSFGHSHHDLLAHPHASWPVTVCHSAPDQPCGVPSHNDERDACAICFAVALIENAVASSPPAVVADLDLVDSRLLATADAARHLQTAFMFQARGPPPAV
jgi:hypothetical protein